MNRFLVHHRYNIQYICQQGLQEAAYRFNRDHASWRDGYGFYHREGALASEGQIQSNVGGARGLRGFEKQNIKRNTLSSLEETSWDSLYYIELFNNRKEAILKNIKDIEQYSKSRSL